MRFTQYASYIEAADTPWIQKKDIFRVSQQYMYKHWNLSIINYMDYSVCCLFELWKERPTRTEPYLFCMRELKRSINWVFQKENRFSQPNWISSICTVRISLINYSNGIHSQFFQPCTGACACPHENSAILQEECETHADVWLEKIGML